MTPSIWPAVLSAGLALAALGVPTNSAFVVLGALLMVAGLAGWIGELRHGGDSATH